MHILIDVGNTASKFALINNNEFSYLGRLFNSDVSLISMKRIFNKIKDVEGIYISSVSPLISKAIASSLKLITGVTATFIDSSFANDEYIKIDNKKELGADLLCDIVAAKKEYGNKLAVIDLGTATKILFIDKDGCFSSCAIFLGYQKSKEILSSSTALLPNVGELKIKPISECHNTNDVINASAYYSQLDTINGIISRYEKEVGYSLKRIYTGGNASDFLNEFKNDKYDEYLVLKGLSTFIDR